jgi:hypothetical protein
MRTDCPANLIQIDLLKSENYHYYMVVFVNVFLDLIKFKTFHRG